MTGRSFHQESGSKRWTKEKRTEINELEPVLQAASISINFQRYRKRVYDDGKIVNEFENRCIDRMRGFACNLSPSLSVPSRRASVRAIHHRASNRRENLFLRNFHGPLCRSNPTPALEKHCCERLSEFPFRCLRLLERNRFDFQIDDKLFMNDGL